jgi:hypothetical protein
LAVRITCTSGGPVHQCEAVLAEDASVIVDVERKVSERKAEKVSEKCRRAGRRTDADPPKGRHHGAITATENLDPSAGPLAYHAADQ